MAKGRKAKKAKKAKPAKKKKKAVKRAKAAASRGRAKKSKAVARKAKARRPKAKKAAPRKKKQIVGEGDYQASRSFLKDQSDFVRRNGGEIPKMGKEAEAALEGPQGDELRAAEEEARSHSKSPNEE